MSLEEQYKELEKYQDQMVDLDLYVKENNLDISTDEKLKLVMTDWLRRNIKFYNMFDELYFKNKKTILKIK